MIIQVPITTEVIEKNASLQPNGKVGCLAQKL